MAKKDLTTVHRAKDVLKNLGSGDKAVRERAQSLRKLLIHAYTKKASLTEGEKKELAALGMTLKRVPSWVKALT